MKKIIYSLFLLVFMIIPTFAIDTLPDNKSSEGYYMYPLSSSGINLRSAQYPSRDGLSNMTWKSEDERPKDEYQAISKEIYFDKNIVVCGGYAYNGDGTINSEIRKALNGGTVSIYVTSDTGALEMVSQSNDAYRRPFELYLILKTKNSAHETGDDREKIINIMKISENMSEVTSNPLDFVNDDYSTGSSVFFDIVLAFPDGEKWSENNTVLTSNGKTYYLAQRDDYSAMVTVSIQFKKADGTELGKFQNFTVPFSGYFSHEDSPQISKVSFSTKMYPTAYNLNLATEYNKLTTIASLDVIANYGKNATILPSGMYLFLSSNNNPNIEGDRFRFEKMVNGQKPDVVTKTNSLGFVLQMPDVSGDFKIFDGTGYFKREQDPLVSPIEGDYIEITRKSGNLLHTGNNGGQISVTYYPYNGEISILLDELPLEILEAGLYQEDVYIHIITRF